ncbi:MAG: hypothetical protein AAGF83_02770 [Cyanobacteria bacterium P01_G01_bin.67]
MSEKQIINAIAHACADEKLRFQIIIQDTTLHVYINRPTQASLDYRTLKQRIYTAIAELSWTKFRRIWLHCRILGEIEPDWQSVLELEAMELNSEEMTSMVEAITTAVDATNSIVSKIEQELEIAESFISDPQTDFEDLPTTGAEDLFDLKEAELAELLEDSISELDFSQYCFIRNRRLLYAVLDPPWSNIARLIATFDQFEPATKRSQLPVLEAYLENFVDPDLAQFEPEVQLWWSIIKDLDSDNRHKLAIWLSRYCLNAEQTISLIQEVFEAQAAIDQAKYASKSIIQSNFSSQPKPNQVVSSISNSASNSSGFFRPLARLVGNFLRIFKPTR